MAINGLRRRETFFEGRPEGGPLTLTNIPSVAQRGGLRPVAGFEELPVAPERKSVLEMNLEEKQGLRQRVIDEGKRLGAKDAEIGQVLKARGLSDLQAPERKIIKDVAGEQRFVDTGERVFKGVEGVEAIAEVQSSKILPGGFAQIVRKDGSVELKSVKEANKEIIEDLERKAAELQGLRAGERAEAKFAIEKSKQAFEKMTLTQDNVAAMDDAIDAIDAGAKTGAIQSIFPSIRASSIRLGNVQKQMALNVIGGVTFGALSKGELDLALSKALPTGLDEIELRAWLVEKKTAQEKLVNNLQEAAIFLGTPGNSVADFLKRNKQRAREDTAIEDLPPVGGRLAPQNNTVTVLNPTTNEMETWDTVKQVRIK